MAAPTLGLTCVKAVIRRTCVLACVSSAICLASAPAQGQVGTRAYAETRAAFSFLPNPPPTIEDGMVSGFSPLSRFSASAANGAASAQAYADLATGKLGASSESSYNGTARADARYWDSLTFTVNGADSSTLTAVTIKYLFDGVGERSAQGDGWYASTFFNIGAAGLAITHQQPTHNPFQFSHFGTGFSDYKLQAVGEDSYLATAVYTLKGITSTHGIVAGLATTSWMHARSNFANTASVSFILPDNVTFTSASGEFLTASTAVPEPGTWAMMLLGFFGIGAAIRRSRALAASSGTALAAT